MEAEVDGARASGLPGVPRPAAPPRTFEQLYNEQWWPMVRLATGLVDQVGVAEDVVQDSFTSVYRNWDSIQDPGAVVAYLRRAVVNHSRSALRRRITARRHLQLVDQGTAEAADASSVLSAEHEMVRRALAGLPDRQREVLTLRYLVALSDVEIADATGLSLGGVRSAASRGLAALRGVLGGSDE